MIRIVLSRKLGELRWTQTDLARKTGIRANTINEMYHELVDRVSLEHLDRICTALDCDVSEIMMWVPEQGSENVPRLPPKVRVDCPVKRR